MPWWLRRCVLTLGMLGAAMWSHVAMADVGACQRAIARASSRYVQGRAKALQRCDDAKVRGRLRPSVPCTDDPATAARFSGLEVKLVSSIARSCGGGDRICGTSDDDPISAIGWSMGTCPDYARAGCNQPIANCTDVAECLECMADQAVGATLALYYDAFDATEFRSESQVNRCQQAIGAGAAKFLSARSKALQRCWDGRFRGTHESSCPDPGDGRTTAVIDKAEQRKLATICRACGGSNGLCDGAGDLAVADVGFVTSCPDVATLDGRTCSGTVTDMAALAACVDCVTDHATDCMDAAGVPTLAGPLPALCNPVPTTTSSSTTSSTSSSTSSSSTTSSSTSTSTSPIPTTTSTSSTTSSSTSTSTMPPSLTCPGSALVDATVGVFYDEVSAPALSGVQLLIPYPATTSLPNIPSTPFVDPSRITDRTGQGPLLLGQDQDTNNDSVEDRVELLFALTGATFPSGDIATIRFDCQPGAALTATDFPCTVASASDRVGNDVANPGTIPCRVSALAVP